LANDVGPSWILLDEGKDGSDDVPVVVGQMLQPPLEVTTEMAGIHMIDRLRRHRWLRRIRVRLMI
jgi:hypothetical protein